MQPYYLVSALAVLAYFPIRLFVKPHEGARGPFGSQQSFAYWEVHAGLMVFSACAMRMWRAPSFEAGACDTIRYCKVRAPPLNVIPTAAIDGGPPSSPRRRHALAGHHAGRLDAAFVATCLPLPPWGSALLGGRRGPR